MWRSERRAGLFCGVLLACGTLGAAESQSLVKPGDRVAIFGDSISTGRGYGCQAVALMSQERPDLNLVWLENGHPGWRADHATNAIAKVLEGKPTLVTIMFGTNDLGQQGARGVAALRERLRILVAAFKQEGIRVVLLTTPYTSNDTVWGRSLDDAPLPRMAEEVFALGKEEHLPVFDMYTAMRLAEQERRKQDRTFMMFSAPGDCHPNAAGHAIMARALADFLLTGKTPPRVPFAWQHPTVPVGVAVQLDQPLDVMAAEAKFPQSTPMVLDQAAQIGETNRWKGPQDLSAKAVAAWDDASLYLEVAVTDDVVVPGSKQPAWGDDGIEFFFDTRPFKQRDVASGPGYFQMLIPTLPSNGVAAAACGNLASFDAARVKACYERTASGYTVRFAIPWSTIGFTPRKGADLGFDFAVNDRDDAQQGRYKALWRGAGDDYTDAGSTGTLKLQ